MSEAYSNYLIWLQQNGCRFPSVSDIQLEFPVAFGDYDVIGVRALKDIPSLKAFLFVPNTLIISPQRARESEIGFILDQYPKYFKINANSSSYTLWVYITYEFLKGESSFFHPYFATLNPETLIDWTLSEKNELQSQYLLYKSRREYQKLLFYYKSLLQVFSCHKIHFPPTNLFNAFVWSYKVVETRSFYHGEGLIIPFADNLNHEDVCVDYLTLSQSFLLQESSKLSQEDYQDFSGSLHKSGSVVKGRSHLNRLEKYLNSPDGKMIECVNNVWEVEAIVAGFESSTDEEDFILEEKEERECKEEEDKIEEGSGEKFFVMRAGKKGGVARGQQVFNCYGRLNNTELLLGYGFCLLTNRYDSLCVNLPKVEKESKVDDSVFRIIEFDGLNCEIKVYYLKHSKINPKFFGYFRKILINPQEQYTAKAELKVLCQAEKVLNELKNNFKTSLAEDEELINLTPKIPVKLFYALSFRISQKRILESQLEIIDRTKSILRKLDEGLKISEAHWSDRSIRNARLMYPLREYLKMIKSNA